MVYRKYEGPRWEQGQRKNKFRGERLQLDGDSSPYVHTGSGAAAGWTLHETEEGRPYYHHPTLGTSWTKPPGFGDGGPAQQIPGLDPRPLAMLSPNSRRQQIKVSESFALSTLHVQNFFYNSNPVLIRCTEDHVLAKGSSCH